MAAARSFLEDIEAMHDPRGSGVRLEIRETEILLQAIRDGPRLGGTVRWHRLRVSRIRNTARIAFRQVSGKVQDFPRSPHFLQAAPISEALASATPASVVSIPEIRALATQASPVHFLARAYR